MDCLTFTRTTKSICPNCNEIYVGNEEGSHYLQLWLNDQHRSLQDLLREDFSLKHYNFDYHCNFCNTTSNPCSKTSILVSEPPRVLTITLERGNKDADAVRTVLSRDEGAICIEEKIEFGNTLDGSPPPSYNLRACIIRNGFFRTVHVGRGEETSMHENNNAGEWYFFYWHSSIHLLRIFCYFLGHYTVYIKTGLESFSLYDDQKVTHAISATSALEECGEKGYIFFYTRIFVQTSHGEDEGRVYRIVRKRSAFLLVTYWASRVIGRTVVLFLQRGV